MVRIIYLEVPNTYKQNLKAKLAKQEISLKKFIMDAIDEKIIRDGL